jgi:Mrp family chromosome partitioning ATPase/capsular polysaccharide biosynthesis protein
LDDADGHGRFLLKSSLIVHGHVERTGARGGLSYSSTLVRAERTSPAAEIPGGQWVASPLRQQQSGLAPYVEAVRGHGLLVALIMGLVVAASVGWLALRTPQYEASAEIFVTPLPAESVSLVGIPLLQDLREPTRTIQTAAALVSSQAAAVRTARALGPDWTRQEVDDAVSVSPQGETNILEVKAVADKPELAAQLANTYATSSLAYRRETLQRLAGAAIPPLRTRLRELDSASPGAAELQTALNRLQTLRAGQDPTLSLAQAAAAPENASGPPAWVIIALAVLAGGVLGVGTAVAIDRITPPRITSEEELVGVYPLPILARLPLVSRQRERVLALDVDSETREALRSVYLQFELEGRRPHTIMITSPSPTDGKTTTALAFSVAVASAGASVILIDTDVRRLPIRAGLEAVREPAPTLQSRSVRRAQSETVLSLKPLLRRVVGHPNLQLLDAMDVGFDSVDPHSRDRLADLIRAAANEADYVILDTPPIGVVSDALTLLDLVDAVMLVSRIRSTRRLHVEVARDLLSRAGVSPMGYVVIGERTLGSYPYPREESRQR